MLSLAELVFYSNFLKSTSGLQVVVSSIDLRKEWTHGDGFSYHALARSGIAILASHIMPEPFYESGAEVEIVRVEGMVRPHRHTKHDAVAICMATNRLGTQLSYIWNPWMGDGRGGWLLAGPDYLLLVPRETVHGFNTISMRGSAVPFYLIVVNNEPFTEGDTEYIN